MALQLFSQILGQSVRLRRFDFHHEDGSIEEVENQRLVISNLFSKVYQKEQVIVKQERMDLENKKALQSVAKQNWIKSESPSYIFHPVATTYATGSR